MKLLQTLFIQIMISFIDIENTKPFKNFINIYHKAVAKKQKNIEALCLSSFNASKKEISSRYVNLKYIKDNKFFFFSNYNSLLKMQAQRSQIIILRVDLLKKMLLL